MCHSSMQISMQFVDFLKKVCAPSLISWAECGNVLFTSNPKLSYLTSQNANAAISKEIHVTYTAKSRWNMSIQFKLSFWTSLTTNSPNPKMHCNSFCQDRFSSLYHLSHRAPPSLCRFQLGPLDCYYLEYVYQASVLNKK